MPSRKSTGIGVAIIGAVATVIVGYWQFVYKPKHLTRDQEQYTGRVIDADTHAPLHDAQVDFEQDEEVPQTLFTDSEGVFHFVTTGSPKTVRVRVKASGYDAFDRNVSLTRTGLEDVRLNRSQLVVGSTPTPSPSRTSKTRPISNARPKSTPCTAQDKLFGRCK